MTNEELMNLLTDMGLHEGGMENWVMDNAWVEVAKRVAAHEREECAKVANAWQTEVLNPRYHCDCATAIRRRGEK